MSSSKPSEIKKVMMARSERVKCVDMHPKEPLVLCSLYSGQVTLWNYDTQTMVKSFDVVDQQPVRAVKFITRLQSFACASDDFCVRVFNYNTMEKVKTFEAQQDYIRDLAVHDHLPYLITASDDMTMRMWDWSKGYANTMLFEGHAHYVMKVVFNPKDSSTFASASMDGTVKVWSVTSPLPNFTLEGHDDGVTSVQYYHGTDKPYLISGSDDRTVKIWDYQTKACLQTLSHHVHNVTCVMFHPDLPLLLTGSEDETVGVFSTQTWRQEATLNYNLQRAWTIDSKPNQGKVAIGFDGGLVVIRLGKEEPVMSMDSNGKIYIASTQEITKMEIKGTTIGDVADGEPILLPSKEVGNTEAIPQQMIHGPSGQYIAVLFEGEYTINTTMTFKPKTFGNAIAFVWGAENGTYAILENATTLKVFKQFKVRDTFNLPSPSDALFAGPLMGVRSVDGSISFLDWEDYKVIRKIDVSPKDVVWSNSGELVAVMTENATFVLKYQADLVAEHFAEGKGTTTDGLDFAFDVVEEMEDKVKQANWVGDCLTFVNTQERLSYYIGGEVTSIAVLPRPMYMLGYLPKENRIFLIDKEKVVVSFQLYVSVIDYKTAIVRDDLEAAAAVLPKIPASMRYKVAQFLQAREYLELALEVTPDEEHKLDLALKLKKIDVATAIVQAKPNAARWKQLGDLALVLAYFDLAERCFTAAGDLNSLLLMYSSMGQVAKIAELAKLAMSKGRANVAFTCFHLTKNHNACIDLLVQTHKVAEAAFYARTYAPDRVQELVGKWKLTVAGLNTIRDSLADPEGFPNLFPTIAARKQLEEVAAAAVEPEVEDEDEEVPAEEVEEKIPTPVESPKKTKDTPPKKNKKSEEATPPQKKKNEETPPKERPAPLSKHADPASPISSTSSPAAPVTSPQSTLRPAEAMRQQPPTPNASSTKNDESTPARTPAHPPAPASTPAASGVSPAAMASPPPANTPAPPTEEEKKQKDDDDDLFGDDDDDDEGFGSPSSGTGGAAAATKSGTSPDGKDKSQSPNAAAGGTMQDDDIDEIWGDDD